MRAARNLHMTKNQTRRVDLGLGKTARGGSGGSYATHNRVTAAPPPHFATLADSEAQREATVNRLQQVGYVTASTVESATNPRFTDGIDTWWQQHYERMEHQPRDVGAYNIMPDDYTPMGTSGHALSGLRRTHRMNYRGAGVDLRMPSATAIKRFSKESNKQTFDIPIEMGHSGGKISGYVRVTEGAGGAWDVEALGFPDSVSKNRAMESVTCVLEARRPSLALREAEQHYMKLKQLGNSGSPVKVGESPLQQLQIDRVGRTGAQIDKPNVPSFITGGAYDRATETMTLTMKGGRRYSYNVQREIYQEIMHSGSPGRAYNELVKNKATRVAVDRCTKCRRVTRTGVQHTCPAAQKQRRRGNRSNFRNQVANLMLNVGAKPQK